MDERELQRAIGIEDEDGEGAPVAEIGAQEQVGDLPALFSGKAERERPTADLAFVAAFDAGNELERRVLLADGQRAGRAQLSEKAGGG